MPGSRAQVTLIGMNTITIRHLRNVTVDGVQFNWSIQEEPADCMAKAIATISDAHDKAEGSLTVCINRQGVLTWTIEYSEDNRQLRHEGLVPDVQDHVEDALEEAMKESAKRLRSVLAKEQAKTRADMAEADRQRQNAQAISVAIEKLADLS